MNNKILYYGQQHSEITHDAQDVSVQIHVTPHTRCIIKGNILLKYTNKQPTNKDILLIFQMKIEDKHYFLSKNKRILFSRKEGFFHYLSLKKNGDFEIAIEIPIGIDKIKFAFKKWNNCEYAFLANMSIEELMIPNNFTNKYKTIELNNNGKLNLIYNEPIIYKLTINNIPYEFLAHFHKNSSKLLVLGTSAIKQGQTPPIFQRNSQIKEFPFSTIIFNDPTLYLHDQLQVGWYIGTKQEHYAETISKIIFKIIEQEKIKSENLIFYGSSASGFFSIMMSTNFVGSIAVVTNPQTDILEYDKKVIDFLFENTYLDTLPTKSIKLSLMEYIKAKKYFPNIYYLQNVVDGIHYNKHFLPFIEFYKNYTRTNHHLLIDLYYHSNGHAAVAPNTKTVLEEINTAQKFFKNSYENNHTQ